MEHLNELGFVNGVTGLLVVVVGIILGLYLVSAYRKRRSPQILGFALFILFSCFSWSAVTVNFLIAISENGTYLETSVYMYLVAWAAGLSILPISYVALSLLKEDMLKVGMILSGLLSALFIVVIYFLVPAGILEITEVFNVPVPPTGALPDSSYQGIARIIVAILIIIVLLLGLSFLNIAIRTNINYVRFRGIFIGLGIILYSLMALIDGSADNPGTSILLIVRISLLLSMFLNTIGIIMPRFITRTFNAEKPT